MATSSPTIPHCNSRGAPIPIGAPSEALISLARLMARQAARELLEESEPLKHGRGEPGKSDGTDRVVLDGGSSGQG